MGLEIKVVKPIRFLGTERPENFDDWVYIYSLDFSPIRHLTKFQTGYWEVEEIESPYIGVTCGDFNDSRSEICHAVYGKDFKSVLRAMDNKEIPFDAPFAEMIYFADNEGCFDYETARKLRKDFCSHSNEVMSNLTESTKRLYINYLGILDRCVECEGVVLYI